MVWCTYPRNETLVHQQLSGKIASGVAVRGDSGVAGEGRVVTFNIPTYKIIASIERATVLPADITRNVRGYKAGEGVPHYSQFDKLMSSSSLEGKAFFFKKPQNSEL